MQIKPFEPATDIPYYYPCHFPLIHEVLKGQGSESSLSLLANSRLYGLPSCSSSGLVKTYFDKLDYGEAIWKTKGRTEYPSLEEGLAHIRRRASRGELTIATGTSYYLPYTDDYLNPKYIEKLTEPGSRLYLVDHWLGVYGAEDDRVFVYDPVPARYTGSLSVKAFGDFWKGNGAIPELAGAKRKERLYTYGTVDIEAESKLTPALFKEALLRALATQAHEFLAGREVTKGERTYYFGHAVSLQLLKRLHLGLAEPEASLGSISGFLFDMRWSRYFARDLLRELAERFGGAHAGYLAEFAEIVEEWENAHKRLQGLGTRTKAADRLRELSVALERLIGREYRLYERIRADHAAIPPFAKAGKPERAEALRHREALVRIVLESCREMNRYHNGSIPVELGLQAPLYGRNGHLDSLGLVTLLATVEQGIEEELGIGLALSGGSELAPAMADSPYRTVDSFVGYLLERMPERAEAGEAI